MLIQVGIATRLFTGLLVGLLAGSVDRGEDDAKTWHRYAWTIQVTSELDSTEVVKLLADEVFMASTGVKLQRVQSSASLTPGTRQFTAAQFVGDRDLVALQVSTDDLESAKADVQNILARLETLAEERRARRSVKLEEADERVVLAQRTYRELQKERYAALASFDGLDPKFLYEDTQQRQREIVHRLGDDELDLEVFQELRALLVHKLEEEQARARERMVPNPDYTNLRRSVDEAKDGVHDAEVTAETMTKNGYTSEHPRLRTVYTELKRLRERLAHLEEEMAATPPQIAADGQSSDNAKIAKIESELIDVEKGIAETSIRVRARRDLVARLTAELEKIQVGLRGSEVRSVALEAAKDVFLTVDADRRRLKLSLSAAAPKGVVVSGPDQID